MTAMPEGGLVVIAVTSFADDGTVDEAGVGQLIDFYLISWQVEPRSSRLGCVRPVAVFCLSG